MVFSRGEGAPASQRVEGARATTPIAVAPIAVAPISVYKKGAMAPIGRERARVAPLVNLGGGGGNKGGRRTVTLLRG